MPDPEKGLSVVADFLSKLTLPRVLLGFLFAGGSIMLFALWEQRAIWSANVWQSPALMGAFLVGLLLISVGAAINNLQQRLDLRTAEVYKQMRDQIVDLQHAVEAERVERIGLQARQSDMQAEVARLTLAEKECQARLASITRELASYAGGRRRNDA